MEKTTISFLPAHCGLTEEQHMEAIGKYRDWLDQHGRYGKLYMMNQNRKVMKEYENVQFETPITGVDIYDNEIAMLFKMHFTV